MGRFFIQVPCFTLPSGPPRRDRARAPYVSMSQHENHKVRMKPLNLMHAIAVGAAMAFAMISPAPAAQPEAMSRGAYLARAADCVACHTVADGKPFAGGLKMGTPFGNIYSTNITPDKQTGIGGYTLAEFDRAGGPGVCEA